MDAWFRRLLLILTIGGGFMGVTITTQFFPQANKVIVYIMLLVFVGLYGYGIFVGLKLSEASAPLRHLRLYFGLQIPLISSPVIAYRFCSGLQATIAIIQPGLRWDCRLGSEWQFSILSSAPWGVGIKLCCIGYNVSSVSSIGRRDRRRTVCRPNSCLKSRQLLTATRCASTFWMNKRLSLRAQVALGGGSSALSR